MYALAIGWAIIMQLNMSSLYLALIVYKPYDKETIPYTVDDCVDTKCLM